MLKTRLAVLMCLAAFAAASTPITAQSADKPLRVGGAIKPPERTKTVAPEYPPSAQAGVVVLDITINPQGLVHSARVLKDVAGATDHAIVAVSFWEYTPTLLNGKPVWVVMTVSLPSPWQEAD